jgi:hypothetical protein
MRPNKTVSLSEKQTKAVAFLEKQIDLYRDLGERLRVIGFPLVAGVYDYLARTVKATLDLQIRVIRHPDEFLDFKQDHPLKLDHHEEIKRIDDKP